MAENLFLRKQLALFQERKRKPRPAPKSTRLVLVALAQFFNWRDVLVVVKPATFVKWHRNLFRSFWKWKSRHRGRPALPQTIRELIRSMAAENPTWGQQRIADELNLKLGIKVSPRTVNKYLQPDRPGGSTGHRWSTFVRNHATAIVACDFFVSFTATFRVVYVFVAMEIGSRRILHINATSHPTAEWTIQQFREVLAFEHTYKFVLHDRDGIFCGSVDESLSGFGLKVLRTPVRTRQANGHCERLIGTIRRECLDFLIPLGERHLVSLLKSFAAHYNRGRPHSALGPGTPEPLQVKIPSSFDRHSLPIGYRLKSKPILGGLHHEYYLEPKAE